MNSCEHELSIGEIIGRKKIFIRFKFIKKKAFAKLGECFSSTGEYIRLQIEDE